MSFMPMNKPGFMGLNKGDLLLAGMGMLSGRNFREGLGNTMGITASALARQRQDQEQQSKHNALIRAMGLKDPAERRTALASAMPEAAAKAELGSLYDEPDLPQGMHIDPTTGRPAYIPEYLEGQKTLAEARGGNTENVQSVFTGEDGTQYIVRRNGELESLGVKARNPYQITDVGGVPTAVNRITAQTQALSTPEAVGGNKATISTVQANELARVEAQQGLPQYQADADYVLDQINQLMAHPGFDSRYGLQKSLDALHPFDGPIPGTDGAGAQALIRQIGGATFLQAYERLKGGGVITEVEGDQAKLALNRATDQSTRPAEARKAWNEFAGYIVRGLEREKAKAQGAYAPQGANAPDLVYNPATGDFE